MDHKTERINFYIAVFNLLTVASINEKFFSNSFYANENFFINLALLVICSLMSLVLLVKRSKWLLLINHIALSVYLFYYFQNNYLAQSYIFWINALFLWIGMSFFSAKINYSNRLNAVQFYLVSCYALAGIQKCVSLLKANNVFGNKMAMTSSLLSDYVFLSKNKSSFINLFHDYSMFFNISIGLIIVLQVALICFYREKNKVKIAVFLCLFHLMNALFLGISFIHAMYLLIIFFLVPHFTLEDTKDSAPAL